MAIKTYNLYVKENGGWIVKGNVGGSDDSGGEDLVKQIIERTATEIKDDTVETVGNEAFYSYTDLVGVDFPNLKSIGTRAFYNCYNLAITSLPSGVNSIGNNAFYGCSKLALTSLPSGLMSISATAFEGCSKLAITRIPSGVKTINNNAFKNCISLTSITFEGTPTTITSVAFSNCTNLTTINVPWAEGAVANAPWGATNATINYNYTGG